jgi:GTPase SAR1 family protein/HAMP domain-containing protein
MDTYDLIKKQILEINQELFNIIETAGELPGITGTSFDIWKGTCNTIDQQVRDDNMRVAVVGAIKSGKSTFVNALFKGDYLKRGAGVVTSIVTRIRQGDRLNAMLFFKTWDEINADMDHAMVLFPSTSDFDKNTKINIQKEENRKILASALSELQTEHLISQDTRSTSSVLLSSYLKGYDRVKDIISYEPNVLSFKESNFDSHREFVGDDSLSVYLNDVQLEIISDEFGQNLEIADCQGSDSPNPLHLAMIEDYLVQANLIIYVVSSRTGIRRADIRFLSIIKKMGLLDSTFFVINCDFSEHDTIEDLHQVRRKITEEIALIALNPEIYSFSSLYHLFKNQEKELAQMDSIRVIQWENQPEFMTFHQNEFHHFNTILHSKITNERAVFLAQNHLTRLSLITSGIRQWIGLNKNMLVQDIDSVRAVSHQIDHHKTRLEKVKKFIRNSLNGATVQIKKNLRREIDRFFDIRSGSVLGDVIDFVRSYPAGSGEYVQNLNSKSFANVLFLVYQDFRQSVDLYMAQSVNPEIIQLARRLEQEMIESLEGITDPFEAMVQDTVKNYNRIFSSMGVEFSHSHLPSANDVDLKSVKQSIGLKLPNVQAAMQYSAKIKTEVAARLGYYTLLKLFKKIVRKNISHEKEGELKALKAGIKRMKREMEKSMDATFRDYRENIKFQYFLKLVDALVDDLYARLLDQFQAYVTDLFAVMDDFSEKRMDKSEMSKWLDQMDNSALAIDQKVGHIKEKLFVLSSCYKDNKADQKEG